MINSKDINEIRNLAIKLEEKELQVSYELMKIAQRKRPDGLLINEKVFEYEQRLENNFSTPEKNEVLSLLKRGDIAIIPIGFRCHTKKIIKNKLGFSQPSLPFDSGFFSPYSVASIFKSPRISLIYNDSENSAVCKKYENFKDENKGAGIKFELSSYREINGMVSKKKAVSNEYLDSTYGYYTLDKIHKFVLAHYNWHPLANDNKSKGIVKPKDNIPLINDILNKRISRMLDMCAKAKYVFFIYLNDDGDYIKIGEEFYDLNDYSELRACLDSKYDFKYSILDAKYFSPDCVLEKYKSSFF